MKGTCWTKQVKALVLSLPAAGEWYIVTQSRNRYSVFSCSPAGSSNSRACVIPDCIMVMAEFGPELAREVVQLLPESPGIRTLGIAFSRLIAHTDS